MITVLIWIAIWCLIGAILGLLIGKAVAPPVDPWADLDNILAMSSHQAVLDLLPKEIAWSFTAAGQPCVQTSGGTHGWRFERSINDKMIAFCPHCYVRTEDLAMIMAERKRLREFHSAAVPKKVIDSSQYVSAMEEAIYELNQLNQVSIRAGNYAISSFGTTNKVRYYGG